ncbi:collagen alpha-1(III) chain-like isoform X1 [Mustela putorius furo]|uniref:Collagen alpha-1(III) chain-like isoform X1 n=1 Tax=Mustela putorius furo TaxID=9669 RepID=A0A8U0SCM8_MUSPF|nr:collagen alpha-1(III) chain-like isoform X1 [Mustela putorius furo]
MRNGFEKCVLTWLPKTRVTRKSKGRPAGSYLGAWSCLRAAGRVPRGRARSDCAGTSRPGRTALGPTDGSGGPSPLRGGDGREDGELIPNCSEEQTLDWTAAQTPVPRTPHPAARTPQPASRLGHRCRLPPRCGPRLPASSRVGGAQGARRQQGERAGSQAPAPRLCLLLPRGGAPSPGPGPPRPRPQRARARRPAGPPASSQRRGAPEPRGPCGAAYAHAPRASRQEPGDSWCAPACGAATAGEPHREGRCQGSPVGLAPGPRCQRRRGGRAGSVSAQVAHRVDIIDPQGEFAEGKKGMKGEQRIIIFKD